MMRTLKIKVALLAAAAFALSLVVDAETLYSDGVAEHNGAVEFMRGTDGVSRIVAAEEALTLQLLDGKGNPTRIKSSDFAFVSHAKSAKCAKSAVKKLSELGELSERQNAELEWSRANGLVFRMSVTATEGLGPVHAQSLTRVEYDPSESGVRIGEAVSTYLDIGKVVPCSIAIAFKRGVTI